MLVGFGQGFGRPGFSAGASLSGAPAQQGDIAGYVTAANGMGYVVSPIFGLWMYDSVSPAAPFIFCAGVLALMTVYAWVFVKQPSPAPADMVAKETVPD
jgi:MFS family permease